MPVEPVPEENIDGWVDPVRRAGTEPGEEHPAGTIVLEDVLDD
jgi:hypothetical protein